MEPTVIIYFELINCSMLAKGCLITFFNDATGIPGLREKFPLNLDDYFDSFAT